MPFKITPNNVVQDGEIVSRDLKTDVRHPGVRSGYVIPGLIAFHFDVDLKRALASIGQLICTSGKKYTLIGASGVYLPEGRPYSTTDLPSNWGYYASFCQQNLIAISDRDADSGSSSLSSVDRGRTGLKVGLDKALIVGSLRCIILEQVERLSAGTWPQTKGSNLSAPWACQQRHWLGFVCRFRRVFPGPSAPYARGVLLAGPIQRPAFRGAKSIHHSAWGGLVCNSYLSLPLTRPFIVEI
ncbi:GL16276 [Drosophila persimilis]|uniref:GL16276 n=1 Tax=Drosophila persimilis TaxID=7234 RepID=B4HAH9_DROPE|nr:GL16276 [Drosophila persimilis]